MMSLRARVADCRSALQLEDDIAFPASVAMLPPLLGETLDALQAGYGAAACALGAAVIDSVLRRTSGRRLKYAETRDSAVAKDFQNALAENDFRMSLSMRPIFSLFTEWYPIIGTPPPKMASRHVVAHWADPDHLSDMNAVLIAMVATSLLRAQHFNSRRSA